MVALDAQWADGPGALLHVAVTVENTVDDLDPAADRDVAMRRSLVAVHTLLAVDDGEFVSLLDPPDFAAEAAAGCRSEGVYPVLVGPPGSTAATADVVLSSPIILYDHPAVAPESQGDMFDATEIDEILALRVLTLTDEEKAEARGTDARAAAIVDRCDDLPPEVWERLHGAIRSIGPSTPEPDAAEPGAKPWWDPGMDGSVDPFDRHDRRSAGASSAAARRWCCGRRGGPTPTTCSSPASRPPWPACSTTSTAASTSPSPSTTTRRRSSRRDRAASTTSPPTRWSCGEGPRRRDRQHLLRRRRLRRRRRRPAARRAPSRGPTACALAEYGIRGVHLAYELLDGYDALVLVDALPMGEAPGTVAVLEVDPADVDAGSGVRRWTPTR